MTAAADQAQPVPQLHLLAVPEANVRVGPHHIRAIPGVQVNRNAAERLAPLHHARVVVRVRDGDRSQPSGIRNRFDRFVVEQRDAVPEQIASGCPHQKRALPDRELRVRREAEQVGLFVRAPIAVALAKFAESSPLLPVEPDVLPLVQADRALRWRRFGRRELGSAGHADETLHRRFVLAGVAAQARCCTILTSHDTAGFPLCHLHCRPALAQSRDRHGRRS